MNAVDTNVLIYSCDESDPARQQVAQSLIQATAGGPLVWQVACEFIAASRKLSKRGFSTEAAWARLAEFLDIYRLVLPTPPF